MGLPSRAADTLGGNGVRGATDTVIQLSQLLLVTFAGFKGIRRAPRACEYPEALGRRPPLFQGRTTDKL